jgi:hypothetical protein
MERKCPIWVNQSGTFADINSRMDEEVNGGYYEDYNTNA